MAGGPIYSAQSASAKIEDGPGTIVGIFVTSSSSLTLKAWDNNVASGNVIFDTTAAITAPAYYPITAAFRTGLFITIGGTGKYTVFYTR